MVDEASLKRYQTVLNENESNIFLATCNEEREIAGSIITANQDKNQPNVFYVVTNPASKRALDIANHPQVAIATWYDHKNGDRLTSNEAFATITTDVKTMQEIAKPYPAMTQYNPTLEGQCVLTITLKSALIESFKGEPEVIKF